MIKLKYIGKGKVCTVFGDFIEGQIKPLPQKFAKTAKGMALLPTFKIVKKETEEINIKTKEAVAKVLEELQDKEEKVEKVTKVSEKKRGRPKKVKRHTILKEIKEEDNETEKSDSSSKKENEADNNSDNKTEDSKPCTLFPEETDR